MIFNQFTSISLLLWIQFTIIKAGSRLIGESCNSVTDCVDGAPSVYCPPSTKICLCTDNWIQKIDRTGCLRVADRIGGLCEEPAQCQHGIPGPYSNCTDIGNNVKQCQCQEIAVADTPTTSCLLKATYVEDPCEIQVQCLANIVNSQCLQGKCTCLDTTVPSTDRTSCLTKRYLGDACEDHAECNHIPYPAGCHPEGPDNDLFCKCNEGYISPPGAYDICYELAKKVNDSCAEHPLQCTGLPRSYCFNESECHCEPNAVVNEEDQTCVLKKYIGQSCTVQEECSHLHTPVSCSPINESDPQMGSICKCHDGFVNPPGTISLCLRLASVINDTCDLNDVQCSSVPESYCDKDLKKCLCNSTHLPSKDQTRCLERLYRLNSTCDEDDQCRVSNSHCQVFLREGLGECRCNWGFVESVESQNKCLEIRNDVNLECEENVQCTEGIGNHSRCQDNLCQCLSGYQYYNGRCYEVSYLGGECQFHENCYVGVNNLTECVDNVCQCRGPAIDKDGSCSILDPPKRIGDSCEKDFDCLDNIPGNVFCKEKTCQCQQGSEPSDDLTTCKSSASVIKNVMGFNLALILYLSLNKVSF